MESVSLLRCRLQYLQLRLQKINLKLREQAAEALQTVPKVLDLTAVGVGTTQSFTAKNLNSKVLVTLDNNIQSPVIQSPVEVKLSFDAASETDFITLTGISSFFSGDVIKVNDEFMKIDTVGIGSTNRVLVRRGQLNSAIVNHDAGDTVIKFLGNYQIVKDTINFTDAPKGSKGPCWFNNHIYFCWSCVHSYWYSWRFSRNIHK